MSTTTIFITATPEPPAFHKIDADHSCVSAHLAFHGEEGPVKTLLEKSNWKFTVYRVEKDLSLIHI